MISKKFSFVFLVTILVSNLVCAQWRVFPQEAGGQKRKAPDWERLFDGTPEEQKSKIDEALLYIHWFRWDDSENVSYPPDSLWPVLKDRLQVDSQATAALAVMKFFKKVPDTEIDWVFRTFAEREAGLGLNDLEHFCYRMSKSVVAEYLLKEMYKKFQIPPYFLKIERWVKDFLFPEFRESLLLVYRKNLKISPLRDFYVRNLLRGHDDDENREAILKEWNDGNLQHLEIASTYSFLSATRNADMQLAVLTKAKDFVAEIIRSPTICEGDTFFADYYRYGEVNLTRVPVFTALGEYVLERAEPWEKRKDILDKCLAGKGIILDMSDSVRARIVRDIWPRLFSEIDRSLTGPEPTHFFGGNEIYMMAFKIRAYGASSQTAKAINFFVTDWMPARTIDPKGKALAVAYLEEAACHESGTVSLDADLILEALNNGDRARILALSIAKNYLNTDSKNLLHQKLEGHKDFDEILTESDLPTAFALEYLDRALQGKRFLMSGLYYRAISERWGYAAKSLLPRLRSYSEPFPLAAEEKRKAIGSIYAGDPASDLLLNLPLDEQKEAVNSIYYLSGAIPKNRLQEMFLLLPGKRETESLVSEILWLFLGRIAELNAEQKAILFSKMNEVYDIHLNKGIDHNLVILYRHYLKSESLSTEQKAEVEAKIKELEDNLRP